MKTKSHEWKGAPQMETGAPMPVIRLQERRLFVAYIPSDENGYVVVCFSGVSQHIFGYPNDEALPGHPLYSAGLEYYTFNEISDSPYLQLLAERNKKVFPKFKSRFPQLKHWVVSFHDQTLEVVGENVMFLGIQQTESAEAAIEVYVAQPGVQADVHEKP